MSDSLGSPEYAAKNSDARVAVLSQNEPTEGCCAVGSIVLLEKMVQIPRYLPLVGPFSSFLQLRCSVIEISVDVADLCDRNLT